MRRRVAQRIDGSQQVVLASHQSIIPTVSAEKIKVRKRTKRCKLQVDPHRHLIQGVFIDKSAKVSIAAESLDLTLSSVAIAMIQTSKIVYEDRIAVFAQRLGHTPDKPRFR